MSEQQRFGSYTIGLKDFIDLLLIGPIFTILTFLLMRRIITDYSRYTESKDRIQGLYVAYLIAIVLFNYGTIIHVTMNRLNSQITGDLRSEGVYDAIYFLDEVIGHLFLTLGFFLILYEAAYLHMLTIKHRSEAKDLEGFMLGEGEKRINLFYGIALGVITTVAYLEGQCAFIFLILYPIFTVLFIIMAKKQGVSLQENSFLVMILLMTIFFTISTVLYAFITGIKPVYPFFYQPSEL